MQQTFPRGFGAKKDRATTGNGIFGFGRKFLLENQMVRDISLGKVQKILAAILGDAIFHVFLVCSANLDIFCGDLFSHRFKLQDFHAGSLCKW